MKLLYIFLSLFILVRGFAIVANEGANKVAIIAESIENGAQISFSFYKVGVVLGDNEDWLIDSTSGQIYLKYYPNFVIGISGDDVQLLDKTTLGSNPSGTHWTITKSGNGYTIRNTGYSLDKVLGVIISHLVFQFLDPVPTFDYIIVGTGTAGSKLAKRLTDDKITSVLSLDAGKRCIDDPFIQSIITWRQVAYTADYNFVYYTEPNPNLLGVKVPAGVGRMWGGTSGHNGFVYDKGLPYDWANMAKNGGSANWDYSLIKKEYNQMENYSGPLLGVFGTSGEVSITQSPDVPTVTSDPFVTAASKIYPNYAPGPGINSQDTGSSTSFQLTMQNLGPNNFIRESSATAHLGIDVVDTHGNGVAGRKLNVISVNYVDKLIFHHVFTTRAIGIQYVGSDAQVHYAYVNKEVILSAGVYNNPAVLMRSGVGNCSELAAFNISCVTNNRYVGANLRDHLSFQVMFTAPPQAAAELNQRLLIQRRLVEGRIMSPVANAFTDFTVSDTVQPDTKLLFLSLPALSGSAALANYGNAQAFNLPIFSISAVLLRPKSLGKVSLATTNPVNYPRIDSNYLVDPDDYNWTRSMYRDISRIIDELAKNDSRYVAVYPTKAMINDDSTIGTVISTYTSGYSHPTGTCRMAPQDDISRGVVDGNLCVYGLDNVRVMDASIFAVQPSGNLQAPIYAASGRAAEIIKSTKCT